MTPLMIRLARCGLLLLALPAAASAAGDALTLERAVALAHERAPSLAAARAGLRAADAGVDAAGVRPNPILGYETENVGGTGPFAGMRSRESTTSLQLPIELGGKRRARIGVADAERAGAAIDARAAAADLTLHTTEAFIAVIAGERRRAAAQARLGFAERAQQAAELRVRNGKVSPIEAQRAQVQTLAARAEADRTARSATLAVAVLAQLTGTPGEMLSADWFDATARDGVAGTPDASLELAARDVQVATAKARLVAAQRARIPDVTVVAGTRRFAETNDTAAVIGLSLPIPLFDRGTAGVARAQADIDRAEAERAAAAQTVEQALARAQAEMANAQAAATAAAGPVLAAATETARIARIGYAEGKFSQLDLLDAERSLADTQRDAIDALAAFHESRARLARLLGSAEPLEKD
jgi:cobalt-zinc-cadmium efflux system outer membrane protein